MDCFVATLLLMNSYGLSLRARVAGPGNPARISDGSPRRFAPRDDKEGSSLLSSPKAPRLGPALATISRRAKKYMQHAGRFCVEPYAKNLRQLPLCVLCF